MSKNVEAAYLRRMPILKALTTDERTEILEVLDRYHRMMEKETYQLVVGIVNACLEKRRSMKMPKHGNNRKN
jgi:hypothetical protein